MLQGEARGGCGDCEYYGAVDGGRWVECWIYIIEMRLRIEVGV